MKGMNSLKYAIKMQACIIRSRGNLTLYSSSQKTPLKCKLDTEIHKIPSFSFQISNLVQK